MNQIAVALKSFFSPFWKKKAIKLELTGSSDDCLKLIKNHTTMHPFDFRKEKLFGGIVLSNRIWCAHNRPMLRNALRPTLCARIVRDNDRTILVGSIGMATSSRIYLLFWYIFLASLALTDMILILQDPLFSLIFIALFIAPLVIFKIGISIGKNDEAKIRENLISIFNAKDITAN